MLRDGLNLYGVRLLPFPVFTSLIQTSPIVHLDRQHGKRLVLVHHQTNRYG